MEQEINSEKTEFKGELIKDKSKTNHRRAAVIAVLLTNFTMPFMGSALNMSIPMIGKEFGVSASSIGWMITIYMLVMAALNVPFGRLADITCRKTVFIIGCGVFVAGCVGAVFSATMSVLLTMRVVQGIGAAMVTACNVPILISSYPPQMRGRALGLSIGAVYVGGSLGPVLGGVLNHQFSWRAIFIFAAILITLAFVVAIAKLPHEDSVDKGKRRMDYIGSVLFAAFIVFSVFGLSNIEAGLVPIAIFAAGIVLGIVFVYNQVKQPDPVLNVSLFRSNIGYTLSNVAALMNYAATAAIAYLLSIYLQVVLGYSSQLAGIIMISQPVIMAMLTPNMGKLSDKYSPFKMSSLGMGFCCLGTIFFIFLKEDTDIVYVIIALIITGIGFALFSSPNTNAILSCVDKKDYAAANALVNTMRSIGQTTSMAIVTIIVSFMLPNTQLENADTDVLLMVMRTAFIVFAIMCFVGVFISLKRKKV